MRLVEKIYEQEGQAGQGRPEGQDRREGQVGREGKSR
jgi:hypothetical protein